MKVESTGEVVTLEQKRCYLPINITSTCPECGEEITKYLANDYLSFPKVNEIIEVSMYHCIQGDARDDEHSWEVKIIIRVTAEPAP